MIGVAIPFCAGVRYFCNNVQLLFVKKKFLFEIEEGRKGTAVCAEDSTKSGAEHALVKRRKIPALTKTGERKDNLAQQYKLHIGTFELIL